MTNNQTPDDMLKILSGKLHKSPDSIRKSAETGNLDGLLSSLSTQQRDKVNRILSDPEATKKLMENPGVQALIKKLSDNG